MTPEAEILAASPQALRATLFGPRSLGSGNAARPRSFATGQVSSSYGDDTPTPDGLDAKLSERARREGRSEQERAIEAVRDAQDRAELEVDDVLAELVDSDAEILHHLK
jgi:hypothetical protein